MSTEMQLRHAVTVTAGATPASGTPEYWDGEIPWVTPEDVGRSREGYWLHDTRRKLTEDGYANCGATLVPDHSIVLTKRAPIGQLAVLSMEACCNQGCFLLSPCTKHDARFVYYLLTTQANLLQALGRGSTFMELATDDLKALKLIFPPLTRQQAIAAYLDRETAKIDAMIAAKERLLALLAEKRRALITHAVTRGLNPDAPMKDSGVEWLGEIPEHWPVMAIKHALAMPITDGPHETPEFVLDGIPFLSAESVKNDQLDFDRKRGFISAEDHARFSRKYVPHRGDVYMVKSGATTGNVARVETDEVFNIWSPLAVLRTHPLHMTTDYLFYFMKSKGFLASVELAWSYGTQQNIGMGVISNLRITVPPLSEQAMIAKHVNSTTRRLDALSRMAEGSLSLLHERRGALIAAAVTGQVDVEDAA